MEKKSNKAQIKEKESENSYQKLKNTVGQAQKNTRKLKQNNLTNTAIFLNRKRANVCEHMTKMASLESFGKVPPPGDLFNFW